MEKIFLKRIEYILYRVFVITAPYQDNTFKHKRLLTYIWLKVRFFLKVITGETFRNLINCLKMFTDIAKYLFFQLLWQKCLQCNSVIILVLVKL